MEKINLYDENKNLTNEVINKGDPIPKGRYYITVVVWIQNSNNEFLIQKTVPEKHHMWGTTGGHPKSGENSLEGIIQEVKEELGLDINSDEFTLFKTIKTEDDFVDLYYVKKDINIENIIIQEDEVEKVMWASRKEIDALIETGEFLPPHIEFYQYCLEFLDSIK